MPRPYKSAYHPVTPARAAMTGTAERTPMTDNVRPGKNRILVIGHDRVDVQMAGQGVRFWELARALSREFSVTLAVPNETSLAGEGLDLLTYPRKEATELEDRACHGADVVVTSPYLFHQFPWMRELPIPVVADVNVPVAAESLAWHTSSPRERQHESYRYSWQVTQAVAQHADFLICPGERQRDYWLGVLAAYGRLHPDLYALDPELRTLIDTVPFGCQPTPPQGAPALKGVIPGIGTKDQVILWAGGIWNWFDPITLLQALPQVLARHPQARLVFLGADHPDSERIPEMEQARQARAMSREMGLEGVSIFWVPWVAYEERGAYLLDADVGVSLHKRGIESRLAFRTRLLDSIWAGLPMVLSRGDVLAQELEKTGAALTVEAGAVEAVAQALNTLLDDPDTRSVRAAAFDRLRARYAWEQVTRPLKQFCHAPYKGPSRQEALGLLQAQGDKRIADLESENMRLTNLVYGYESGRVMRILSTFHQIRSRLKRQ